MEIEPAKISELTQEQRNALITALGCKTIHRMNNGDSLPIGFIPDELFIDSGIISYSTSINPSITIPEGYIAYDVYSEHYSNGDGFIITNPNEDLLFQMSSTYDTLKVVHKGQYTAAAQLYIQFYPGDLIIVGNSAVTASARFILKLVKYVTT